MQNKPEYTETLLERHFKLLAFIGIFFLILGFFTAKSEYSKIPDVDKLFITEGILKLPFRSGKYPSIFIQPSNNHLIRLSTYRGYGIHKLRKFKNKKVKVWWHSESLDRSNDLLKAKPLYQLEIDGEIVIKFSEQVKARKNGLDSDIFFLMSISFTFLLFATFGYLNALDSGKTPKL